MNYSLGNMLSRGGSLNADGLSLDLQFATDKTLTARKGPTPTFTRASTATFIGSNGLIQSSALNTARFDHDPVTLASRGLLIEEARTNLFVRSEEFGTTWTAQQLNTTGSPAYLNVATAPDGNTTADKLIATAVLSTHQFRQSVTLVSGTVYSVTCYFKAAEQQFASIAAFGVANGSADWVSLFNISSSPATGTFNGFTSTSVTNAGNGWIRCAVVFTATASGSLEIRLGGASATSGITPHIYLGDGTSGILLWGAQLEAGSFPTSYIPTVASSVVRSADVCSITGASFTGMYNATEGTLFAGVTPQPTTQLAAVLLVNTTTFNNLQSISKADSAGSVSGLRWTLSQNPPLVTSSISLDEANVFSKISMGYKSGDSALYYNNKFGTSTSSVFTSINPTQMQIGGRDGQRFINGHISEVKYFKKRLSNAKLQTITV